MSMNEKTDVQVIINGKQYTICGYESSDYLQHIANHINEKFDEFKRQDAYNRLDMDMKNILLAINLSDDFFKAQKLAEENKQQQGEVEQEMFRMRHELVSRDEEMKTLKAQLKEAQEKAAESEKKNIRLETEVEQKTKEIEQKTRELEEKDKKITEKTRELEQRDRRISQKTHEVEEKNLEIIRKTQELEQKDNEIVRKTQDLEQKKKIIEEKNKELLKRAAVTETASAAAAKAAEPIKAAVTTERTGEDMMMSGIQPVKESLPKENQPSIAAFDLETDPQNANAQAGQNDSRGRKNSGSRHSQNKRR